MNRIYDEPMTGFELRLLDALREVDSGRPHTVVPVTPSTRPRWARPLVAAAVASLLVAGGVAGGLIAADGRGHSTGDGHRPAARLAAFTVHRNADDSVTVTFHDLVDPTAATQALNDAGIAGRVVNSSGGCSPISKADLAPGYTEIPRPGSSLKGSGPVGLIDESATVTLRSSDYPAGGGVMVVVSMISRKRYGPLLFLISYAYQDVNKIPTCVNASRVTD